MIARQMVMLLALVVSACRSAEESRSTQNSVQAVESPVQTLASSRITSGAWTFEATSAGVAMTLRHRSAVMLQLICPAGKNRLLVNVPSFTPIGSEERMSFGSDAGVVALVADTRGDLKRGGVTGAAEVPEDIKELVTGPIQLVYGTQRSGPHPVASDDVTRDFFRRCYDEKLAALRQASKPTATTNPCLVQDGYLVQSRFRALGTEPFWAATVEGRCITYSTPEDQKGLRIWTRIHNGPDGGIWVGFYKGKPFQLIPTPSTGCSDGMSDKKYPMAVELLVEGEIRRGCAEPRESAG